jgi:hypothetical protein
MDKLTKARRMILKIAGSRDSSIYVFLDMKGDVTWLEANGLMKGNGRRIERKSTITEAGRAALQEVGQS